MEKILVTGSEGFLASRIIKKYGDKYEIIPMNKNMLNITNEKQTIQTIRSINPKYVIHTAAIADTGICQKNPELSYEVNVNGVINIAKACSLANSKLVNCSSEQIYNGNDESGPYKENCDVTPNSVYAVHKLNAEREVDKLLDNAVHLRLTWMFGLPERGCKVNTNIITNIIRAIMNGDIYKAPSNEYRGMTYVHEVVENMEKIINLPKGIYNTGSENDYSTYEVAKIVVQNLKLNRGLEEVLENDSERFKEKQRDLRIDNNKLRKSEIYFSTTEDAIKKCLREFKI